MNYDGEFLYLTSCPFCGEQLRLGVKTDLLTKQYFVRCDMCLSRGPIAGNVKPAVSKWNEAMKRFHEGASVTRQLEETPF